MRFITPASVLALAIVALAENNSDVLSPSTSSFEATVNAESLVLVEFTTPWCGNCKRLEPHYKEAATALKDKGIKVAKVDCVDEAGFCQTQDIQRFPTFKVYRKGKAVDYNGPHTADGIISYMTKLSLPTVSELTVADLDEFKNSNKLVAIAFVGSKTDALAPPFSAAAETLHDDWLFGISSDKDAIEAAGITPPTIVVYRSFDEPKSVFPYPTSDVSPDDITIRLKELAAPIINEITLENYDVYRDSGKPLAYLFVDPKDERKEEYISLVKPVASKYMGKVNFVWMDAERFGEHGRVALNIPEAKWPAFVVSDLKKQLKYPLDQSKAITTELVDELVGGYLSGKIQPFFRSQPIPEAQEGPVLIVVGKTYDEIVADESKDLMLEFYAAVCPDSKRLAPIYNQLAEKYRSARKNLVIAKIDVFENELPPSAPFDINLAEDFPEFKFKPAGSTEFIDYKGDRSLESFAAFIEEHAKNPPEHAHEQIEDPQVTLSV